ncbi:MAG TPA: asparagine synthase (glutamine-hydrolyzing) [Xanthobacteraceae bacterium]|nr:asparagine synthase (glutamine-hydrolyzing) [Xanthobacteraceae bacterium]
MCGIAGFAGPGDRDTLAAMTRALVHRGPDGEGFYQDPERAVFLGHTRLAIVDLAGGAQPMANEDESVYVVFNGEIYNHMELRRALIARGHRFRSDHSDTEVLVHGYEEWGADLPVRLNGMFAFAIYDRTRGRLFLARDRFGEKPLSYTARPGFFAFASETRAILAHPRASRSFDSRALQKYFAHGFLPAPHSAFEHCRRLPGGCHLTYDIASGATAVGRYWRFSLRPDESLTQADDDRLAEELRALLIEAVRRRLMSDVPLGLFLSGGIDSSAVLAAATALLGRDAVETFTVGFTEPSFDESAQAREVAAALGARHHAQRLDLDGARDLIPEVLARMDEPLGDASLLPTSLLSAFTRRSVTVALSGDGGDELFAGYDPFKALAPAQVYHRLVPAPLHRTMRSLAGLLPISSANMSLDFKLRRALQGLSYPPALWNAVWLAPLEPAELADVFTRPLPAEELYEEVLAVWETGAGKDLVDRTLEFYTNFYLQDGILMKVDRAAMMHSLETRAIFLDNDLVAFCERLPHRFKIRRGARKYLLRRALRGLLPEAVLQRPKKGFGIPLAKWLRSVPASPPLAPVSGVRMEAVAARWQAHRAGRADHRLFLWSWLALQGLAGPEAQAAAAPQPAALAAAG